MSEINLSPYTAESAAIDRRRKMAEVLQAQSMQPLDSNQMAGGWVVPVSPYAGLAKMLQGYNAGAVNRQADQDMRDLYAKHQAESADTLQRAFAAGTGTPGRPAQPPTTPMDDEGNPMPGVGATAAVPPNRAEMARILSGSDNPAYQAMGLHQMGQDMENQRAQSILEGLGFGSPQASPTQALMAQQFAGGAAGPTNAAAARVGQPNAGLSGVSPQAMALAMSGNPALMEVGKMAQAAYAEENKPQNVRPQGTIAQRNPATGKWEQTYYSGQVGEGMTRSPSGAATVMPGYLEGQAAIGKTPMTQVTNADQTHSYVPTAQLAGAAMGTSAQQPPAPAQQPQPASAGFPRETPDKNRQAGLGQMQILQSEAKTYTDKGQPIPPELQREMQIVQSRIGGGYPTAGKPAVGGGMGNAPKFGQTQEDAIRQAGQTTANTEAGKQFIAEMRDNYAKLRDVPATLENMDRAKTLAASEAKSFMGPLGTSKLAISKFMRANVPGMENLDLAGVTKAEELQSTLFNQVMDNLKKMDASPSQYQQKVMQEAFGTLQTDPASVPKILDVFSDILRNRVDLHNQTVRSAEGRGTVFPYEVSVKIPTKGSGSRSTSGQIGAPLNEQEVGELAQLRKRFGR